ncbi:MAG TPA: gluconate 2-dehydrogenase subunit 3 family protein [Burkholderiaceae bacterium]
MDDKRLSRRGFLTAGAAIGGLPAASATAALLGGDDPPWQEGRANAPRAVDPDAASWAFFTAAEGAFVTAATSRLIPADELGPGAVEAGVPLFIDRQLAGAYGRAERWYMQGPWAPGLPTQGYQTRLTPAGLYRAAIKAVDAAVGREQSGTRFAALAPDAQDDVLRRLEKGELALDGVDAKAFFAQLLQNTLEGFWSDPIYGGNRGMAGWKLIGFPGARYDQSPYVQQHGQPYPLPPVGLSGRVEWIRSAS